MSAGEMADDETFCGCCGDVILVEPCAAIPWWCDRCFPHTGVVGHLWERTYEALNGEPCPFQVGMPKICPKCGKPVVENEAVMVAEIDRLRHQVKCARSWFDQLAEGGYGPVVAAFATQVKGSFCV